MVRIDDPGEPEIAAYVDGEMPAAQRAEIEALAALDEDFAARLREDLMLNDALRRAQPGAGRYSDDSLRMALKLRSRLRARSFAPLAGQIAAAVVFVGVGWALNTLTLDARTTPSVADARFADSAREALRVAMLDTGPRAAGEPISRKIDRLEAVTDVVLPTLPANWRVIDVQVQPFNGKPSVVVTAESPYIGPVTLVAAPMETEGAVPPTPATDDAEPTVYWQSGGTAYALMGRAAANRLKSVADGIEVASRRKSWPKTRG